MTTAREIMTRNVECVAEDETVLTAAHRMAKLKVGALPICGKDDRLKGMITDRDIVVRVVAEKRDPNKVMARELAQGNVITVRADDDPATMLQTMSKHQIRRVPVIDQHRLVGIVAVADVARALPDPSISHLIDAVAVS